MRRTGVRERLAKILVGQDVVVERVMIALMTGGYLLLQGLPGLAKTLLVPAIALLALSVLTLFGLRFTPW